MKAFFKIQTHLSICIYQQFKKRLIDSGSQVIGWPYEAMGVFSAVPWYICHRLHSALHTAGTACDVDAGELEHHILKGVGHLE